MPSFLFCRSNGWSLKHLNPQTESNAAPCLLGCGGGRGRLGMLLVASGLFSRCDHSVTEYVPDILLKALSSGPSLQLGTAFILHWLTTLFPK